jgi:HK97 family phage major capsid protein
MAAAPDFASALGKMKTDGGVYLYPEYRLGRNPETFDGLGSDVNSTVSFGGSDDKAIIGDFENAFKWGFAEDVTFEVIEFGDPDGTGRDLKAYNEVLLRSEAYIGFGILDADSFAIVTDGAVSA